MKSSIPVILIFLIACSSCERKNNITIGFSYPYIENGWGKLLYKEITNQINLQSEYNSTPIEKNTIGQKEKQRKNLNDIVEKIYDKKTPVTIINQNTNKNTSLTDNKNKTLNSESRHSDAKRQKSKDSIMITPKDRYKGFYNIFKTYIIIIIDTENNKNWLQKLVQPNEGNILCTFPIIKLNTKLFRKVFNILDKPSTNLLNQQNLSKNLGRKIKEQKLLFIIFIATVALILAFTVLLYTLSKQKYKYIKLVEEQNNQITQHLKEEQALSEELAHQNDALELYKNELELLVKERTSNLEIALKKAEESDNLKSSFLSNFSHEVRTPLNSIIGFSNLLTRAESKSEDKELFLNYIKSSGRQLLKLIDDLVEASIVNTENIKINLQETSIKHLLKDSFELFKIENAELLNQKEKSVKFTLNTSEDRIIKTDFHRIKQLLGYLIDNAIKFTHNGSVELGWDIINENNKVRIYVKDSGIGIDSKNFENIFKKFVKLEEDISVLYRGTGIGLNIAQRLATFLDTNIHINSVLGKGSIFYFDVTLAFNSTSEDSLKSDFDTVKNTNN